MGKFIVNSVQIYPYPNFKTDSVRSGMYMISRISLKHQLYFNSGSADLLGLLAVTVLNDEIYNVDYAGQYRVYFNKGRKKKGKERMKETITQITEMFLVNFNDIREIIYIPNLCIKF